jgi:hypothetical protein
MDKCPSGEADSRSANQCHNIKAANKFLKYLGKTV